MGTDTAATAAIYCRISQDSSGDALGVTRQEEDCRKLAESHGLTVVDVFTDNDVSASSYSRKKRKQYERMIAEARAGRFGTIVAYSNSRVTRRLAELEDLIRLHEQHGTRILTVVSGQDNLATADGRMVARIKASVDIAESDRISERVTRKHKEFVQAGKVVGGGNRPFGWDADQITVREDEAALIREAVEDVLAGLPLRRIVVRWNNAGVRTTKGNVWTNGLVLQLLRSPRLAGWRVHRPKGSKWTAVPPIALDAKGNRIRGEWEPILTDEQHQSLAALLVRRDDRKIIPKRNARRYLATGMLRCSVCRGPMYANKVGDSHYYRCDTTNCTNSASGKGVDEWIGKRVVEHSELVRGVETGKPTEAGLRLTELDEQIADANDMIDDIMRAFREKRISGTVAFRNIEQLEASRDQWMAERDVTEAESRLSQPEQVDAGTWEGMDTDARRAACERWLSAVWCHPATRRGNTFDTSRLDPVWK
jgi:DNA invertase Pin-like site-specific DNA recombinase